MRSKRGFGLTNRKESKMTTIQAIVHSKKIQDVLHAMKQTNYGVAAAQTVIKAYAKQINSTDKNQVIESFYDYVMSHPILNTGIYSSKNNNVITLLQFFISDCIEKRKII